MGWNALIADGSSAGATLRGRVATERGRNPPPHRRHGPHWLTNTNQRNETVCDCSGGLQCHRTVTFPEMLPPLGMADFDQGRAGILCHPHGDLACPRALDCPVSILGAEQHRRVCGQAIVDTRQGGVRQQQERLNAAGRMVNVSNSSTKMSASASVLVIFGLCADPQGAIPLHVMTAQSALSEDGLTGSATP